MGRTANLEPSKDKSKGLWYLCIPKRISNTGKWRREYFPTKKEAETRSSTLKKIDKHYRNLANKITPELMQDAVELNDLAQIYGFGNLREAFMTWASNHERQNSSVTFGELIQVHEADFSGNWSHGYLTARWKPFCNKVEDLKPTSIALMNSDFWRDWLAGWKKKTKPAPTTYNQTVGLIKTLFSHEKARGAHEYNPIDTIPRLKNVRGEVCVSPTTEVKALLDWCWKNDRELIPYFVLGYFAGLRPQSEILTMTFERINLDDNIIDCVTTKTHRNPRRQIPIETNAYQWLKEFKGQKGSILPKNFRKRHNTAKEKAEMTWGHDIMRHSYGSYYEAINRRKAGCRESLSYNMGHSSFKTYEQNYRNGKITPKQAKSYWAIKPPS